MSEECPVKAGNVLQEKARILFNCAARILFNDGTLGEFTTLIYFFVSLLPFFFAVLIREKMLNKMRESVQRLCVHQIDTFYQFDYLL